MLIKTKSKARLKVQNDFIKCIELSIELFGNLIFPKHSFLKVFYITLDKIIAADNFVIGLSSILLSCLHVPLLSCPPSLLSSFSPVPLLSCPPSLRFSFSPSLLFPFSHVPLLSSPLLLSYPSSILSPPSSLSPPSPSCQSPLLSPWPGVRMWCDWTPHNGARTLSLWLQTVLGPCWTLGSSPDSPYRPNTECDTTM